MIPGSKKTGVVLYGTLLVMSMLLVRILHTQRVTYTFLLWNLFLAFIPLLIAFAARRWSLRSWKLFIATILWLVFFPNATYIITDLYHLSHIKGMPLWYDALLLFTAAFTGLAMGFISLQIMEMQWRLIWRQKYLSNWSTQIRWRYRIASIVLVFFLTGFGIYLGRVLRWNSWDVITNPEELTYDIAHRVINPVENVSTWGFTFIYAIVLFFLYQAWCNNSFYKGKQ